MANAIETLTPNEAWETYVGAQSPREFCDPSEDPAQTVRDYVVGSPMCSDLTAGERIRVEDLLLEHIERNAERRRKAARYAASDPLKF